ncbi:MAG: hypothetical protein WC601_02375 [Desulfotomaculaceae bacterium]
MISAGVLIDESLIGAVLDLLAGPFDLTVRGEVFLSVKQSLMVRQVCNLSG